LWAEEECAEKRRRKQKNGMNQSLGGRRDKSYKVCQVRRETFQAK
jgi:hypothetical protein